MVSFDKIVEHLSADDFHFPVSRKEDIHFPDYASQLLDDYIHLYETKLINHIDPKLPFPGHSKVVVIDRIKAIAEHLKKVIVLYFEGNIHEAASEFDYTLNEIIRYQYLKAHSTIPAGTSFYRGRKSMDLQLAKEDLFHIPFEKRHLVATNRYSISGFPALYLGNTTYTCWEEFDRPNLKNLWFSRFETTQSLKIVQIMRFDDFLQTLDNTRENDKITALIRYLALFPLTLLCSIKVKHPTGSFKPEYIIPQLLLQYIAKSMTIDGVMFPSTKINYSNLQQFSCYNYVFPVKNAAREGFCTHLAEKFHLTEPTSLEMEELMYNPTRHRMVHALTTDSPEKIELVKAVKSPYNNTSFGKIERSLQNREVYNVIS